MSQELKLPPEIAALPPKEREMVLQLLAEKLAMEHVKAMRGMDVANPGLAKVSQGKQGQDCSIELTTEAGLGDSAACKRQTDAQGDSFQLTGSDRPIDAAGQLPLFRAKLTD